MTEHCATCPHERVHAVEYRALTDNLLDLKGRVDKLEMTLTRGVMLLVANLVAVIVSLAQQFLQG